ncbi:uncharacterized protein LOC113562772 [Ooceraea biroi]|uniref:uncharacterized protein LOC113562772 n=1 Tax=Ooceraea biroi TaxID=2015173 RepID=UPI000F082B81|nr:uncharacterized protein LOC113562772 [Ooceraea biroi]
MTYYNVSIYESHCEVIDCISANYPESDFIIAGDYNLPHLRIVREFGVLVSNFLGHCRVARQANIIINYFNEFDMYQHNSVNNSNGDILDLIFSNFSTISVCSADDSLLNCDIYHPALCFATPLRPALPVVRPSIVRWNFRRADYEAINDYLGSINWDAVFEGRNVEDAVGLLYSHLQYAIDSFVPVSVVRSSSFPAWFTHELISMIRAKRKAHYIYKRTNKFSDYLVFARLRLHCKALSRSA